MKKYGKQFVIVVAVAAVLLTLAAVFRFLADSNSLEKALNKTWGLTLPGGYEVEYRAATDTEDEAPGQRFYALLYSDSDALDQLLPWTATDEDLAERAAALLTALDVPGGEWPELDAAGVWHAVGDAGAELLIFHTEGDLRLHILECD